MTTNEDTEYAFQVSDFNFVDTNISDTLASVKVTTLPANGELQLNGTAIASGSLAQTVTAAQLGSNNLKYVPPENANGSAYADYWLSLVLSIS